VFLVVQTKEPRVFRETEIRMLVEAAKRRSRPWSARLAPWIVSLPRLRNAVVSRPEISGGCWDHDCMSLFRDLNPTRWRELNQNPISMLSEMPLGEIESRAAELGFA